MPSHALRTHTPTLSCSFRHGMTTLRSSVAGSADRAAWAGTRPPRSVLACVTSDDTKPPLMGLRLLCARRESRSVSRPGPRLARANDVAFEVGVTRDISVRALIMSEPATGRSDTLTPKATVHMLIG